MMKPTVIDELMMDPRKLSLTNAGGGECHLTRWSKLVGGEEDPQK